MSSRDAVSALKTQAEIYAAPGATPLRDYVPQLSDRWLPEDPALARYLRPQVRKNLNRVLSGYGHTGNGEFANAVIEVAAKHTDGKGSGTTAGYLDLGELVAAANLVSGLPRDHVPGPLREPLEHSSQMRDLSHGKALPVEQDAVAVVRPTVTHVPTSLNPMGLPGPGGATGLRRIIAAEGRVLPEKPSPRDASATSLPSQGRTDERNPVQATGLGRVLGNPSASTDATGIRRALNTEAKPSADRVQDVSAPSNIRAAHAADAVNVVNDTPEVVAVDPEREITQKPSFFRALAEVGDFLFRVMSPLASIISLLTRSIRLLFGRTTFKKEGWRFAADLVGLVPFIGGAISATWHTTLNVKRNESEILGGLNGIVDREKKQNAFRRFLDTARDNLEVDGQTAGQTYRERTNEMLRNPAYIAMSQNNF